MIDLLLAWIALGLYALGIMLACALVRVWPAKTVVAVCALTTARKTAAITVDAIAVDSIPLGRADTGGWRQGVRLAGPGGRQRAPARGGPVDQGAGAGCSGGADFAGQLRLF
jgi:hypothetical protein